MFLARRRLYAFTRKKPAPAAATAKEITDPNMKATMELVWRGAGSGDAVHAAGVEISGVVVEPDGTAVLPLEGAVVVETGGLVDGAVVLVVV